MTALRFERADDDRPLRISFVPLIDVVLQIICFYLFVSAGVQSYQDASVELPVMTAEPLTGEQPAELTINLKADGTLDINGQSFLPVELNREIETARGHALASGQRFMVAIRADRRQRYAALDQVLQSCREAGVTTLSIRALSDPNRSTSGGGQ